MSITGGGTDIQLNAILANGGNVSIGPGIYRISNFLNISQSRMRVTCDPNAIFQAQTAIPANTSMLTVLTTTTDVIWDGGVFDGNSVAANGLQVNGAADRILFRSIEVKGCTSHLMFGSSRSAGTWRVQNCYLHGGSVPGVYDLAADGNTAFLQVLNSNFDSITNIGIGSSNAGSHNGVSYFEASGNHFNGCGTIDSGGNILNALYGFQAGNLNWHHNEFVGCTGALHADTCGSGSVCDNFATGSTAAVDFFVEVTPYVSVERNIGMNSTNHGGITLGVGGSNSGITGLMGVVGRSNKLINCQGGFFIGACNQAFVEGNFVQNPSNGTAFYNSNSVGTHFAFNQSSFASGGTHLVVDAIGSTSTVLAYGDATNAATQYSQINGGTVTAKVS